MPGHAQKLFKEIHALLASGTLYGVASAAVVVGLIWIILGIVPENWLLTVYFCFFGSLLFSLLAVAALLAPATPKQGQDIFSLLMMPMTFFGCTFYSYAMLLPPFDNVALLLPTTYLSEGLRAAYATGGGSLPTNWVAVGLAVTTFLLVLLADWAVARRLRNFTW